MTENKLQVKVHKFILVLQEVLELGVNMFQTLPTCHHVLLNDVLMIS